MYCWNCGKENVEGAKFCGQCGAPLLLEESDAEQTDRIQSSQQNTEKSAPQNTEKSAPQKPKEPVSKKNNWWKILLIVLICAAAVVLVLFFLGRGRTEQQYGGHLDSGRAYLQEASYEEAVLELTDAIGIDAKEVEPYLLLAEAYENLDEEERAEETYDEGRGVILDAYEETNRLPEGAEDLYRSAIVQAESTGNSERADELRREITDLLPENEREDFTASLNWTFSEAKTDDQTTDNTDPANGETTSDSEDTSSSSTTPGTGDTPGGSAASGTGGTPGSSAASGTGGTPDSGSTTPGEEPKSETVTLSLDPQNVTALFDSIANAAGQSDEWHAFEGSDGNGDLSEQEKEDYGLAYEIAALSLVNTDGGVEYETWYYEVDGDMISYEELSGEQSGSGSAGSGPTYYRLSPERYEETLADLFGPEYDPETYDADKDGVGFVKTDEDGNFYIMGVEYFEDSWTDASLESLSEEADEDGTFEAVAKYTTHRLETPDEDFYMQYRLMPDEDSEYGCIIAEMTRLEQEADAPTEAEEEEEDAEEEAAETEDAEGSPYQAILEQYAPESPEAYTGVLYDINADDREELIIQGEDTIQIYALDGEEPVALLDEELLDGYDEYAVHVYGNGAIWLACYVGGDSYVMKGVYFEIGEDGHTLKQTASFWDTEEEPDQTVVVRDGEETEVLDGAPKDLKGLMQELEEEQAEGTDEVELEWKEIASLR